MGRLEVKEQVKTSSPAWVRFKNQHFPPFGQIKSVSWGNYSLLAAFLKGNKSTWLFRGVISASAVYLKALRYLISFNFGFFLWCIVGFTRVTDEWTQMEPSRTSSSASNFDPEQQPPEPDPD